MAQLTVPKPQRPEASDRPFRTFEKYIRQNDLKLTGQRRVILRKVFESRRQFTAEQLIDALRKDGVRVSCATTYRTLALLKRSNLLEEFDFGEGRRYFDPSSFGKPARDNVYCVSCGCVAEFPCREFETAVSETAARLGFDVLSRSLKVYGHCRRCRRP